MTEINQTVTVVYTPSGADKDNRAFLNGLEIDSPDIDTQISFPYPSNLDEHVDLAGATSMEASWQAPKSVSSPTYNVYLGTTNTTLNAYSSGKSQTALFNGKFTI